ncbi:MAG: SDR family oxidoreductase, partial [Vicinamibacterales bacterium]
METQRFLITGGSQGIGAALVARARAAGHQVVFTGRNTELIEKVEHETGARGIAADVAKAADNARVVEACELGMGGVDVLINNAGVGYSAEIGALDVDRMRKLFEINVFGMVDLTNRIAPLMKAQGSGDNVNLASTSGMKGGKGATAYAASKWAIRGITQCWQAELRPHGIRVTSIC